MIEVKWAGNMTFVAKSKTGHAVVMDTSSKVGGDESAATPMEMIIVGLGGCTGMDVISILRKMRQDVKEFKITVKYERADEHPKVYTKIALHYYFKGKNLLEDKVKRAIELSQNKYCSVSEMFKKTAELTYTYEIKNEE